MRAVLRESGKIVLIPENDVDRATLDAFTRTRAGHAFHLEAFATQATLTDLGDAATLLGEPLNITSQSPPPLDLISNFAATPFHLDGADYASVEGFWQSLRHPEGEARRHVAALSGAAAKKAGVGPAPERFAYRGRSLLWGTHDHWMLMRSACAAKFAQHTAARDALVGTGDRILEHRLRRDSRSIPGALMAQIWMDIRRRLRASEG